MKLDRSVHGNFNVEQDNWMRHVDRHLRLLYIMTIGNSFLLVLITASLILRLK